MSKCTKITHAKDIYQCTLHTNFQAPSYVYFTKLMLNKKCNHILVLTTGTGNSTLSPTERTRDYH